MACAPGFGGRAHKSPLPDVGVPVHSMGPRHCGSAFFPSACAWFRPMAMPNLHIPSIPSLIRYIGILSTDSPTGIDLRIEKLRRAGT